MAKRKLHAVEGTSAKAQPAANKKSKCGNAAKSTESTPTTKSKGAKAASKPTRSTATSETIQVVAGSYDQVLHGLSVTIGPKDDAKFADTFLFTAHKSAIRCVAVSPPSAPIPGQSQKVTLASGSTDERINVYELSAHPPSRKRSQDALLATVAPRPVLENPKNRELGTLLHHESNVTALRFPTRSKLLSSSEDSTIAVTRTRDWSTLSTIKAPKPKPVGRPSGDTAALGTTPSGVNDFAVHPSMKVMISVSKGEKCMRLWNLVTGKKGGVLGFDRDMLQAVGEGRHSTGEGRSVVWGSVDDADEFAVGFDRGALVFGMDIVPKCKVMLPTRTKVHRLCYVPLSEETGQSILAASTEDGRIAFFSTRQDHLTQSTEETKGAKQSALPAAKMVGYVGGTDGGVTGRIKDFIATRSAQDPSKLHLVGASSDGKVRVWTVSVGELEGEKGERSGDAGTQKPLGALRGTYETQNRITCLTGFMMLPRPEGVEESEDELDEEEGEDDGGLGSDGEESE